ncbi:MAG: hypothetical protein A3B79_05560 [Deltaproteobacteria bacterium RIFCSPHIGHO2_02_FULL_50_15]|nr:MAG: hypothetical protein A3B79_05560 [Deltaproteobacteria bacterium RIFCSPHIGHO2_02_FULL_50_15]
MGGDETTMPANTNGMEYMAQAMQMSTLFQSNAMISQSQLQASTQMQQANLMYMQQTESLDVKRDIAMAEIDYKREKAEFNHDEAMKALDNEEMEIKLEAEGSNNINTYNPNP